MHYNEDEENKTVSEEKHALDGEKKSLSAPPSIARFIHVHSSMYYCTMIVTIIILSIIQATDLSGRSVDG